ncbi:MAG: dihydroorotase [Candidatus Aminicenantes bacterium]|nr:dihydroorotase [Candidatus Aminicenantes bacterium]
MKTLIKNGRVVDPGTGLDETLDLLIVDGRIADLKPTLDASVEQLIDASRLVVAPGFIDMHVHLREPGYEAKETIATGGRAAARGGFTSVCCMPNTKPVNDRRSVTKAILAEARRSSPVNVFPIASITRGQLGKDVVNMADLAAAGACAFSDDGRPVMNSLVMRRALEGAKAVSALVIDHAEDLNLSAGGIIHEGDFSRRFGIPGLPAAAEEIMVARDICLAEMLETRIHIAHLSVRGAARAVSQARARGVRVSCEVTPHHLILTDARLQIPDPAYKMNPPLRSQQDVDALLAAVRDGSVDVIATDHAPHTEEEKGRGLEKAPFGIVGLETAVPLLLDRLVHRSVISLARLIEMISVNPARLLGLKNKGRIAVGADADLTILNLHKDIVIDKEKFVSLGRNTPFHGWRLKGVPVMTMVAGKVVYPFNFNPAGSGLK